MTAPLVTTLYGKLLGAEEEGVKVWRGIPFAAPPVGKLRFRAPQPPQPWDSVREALSFSPVSHQPVSTSSTRFGGTSPDYSEDCLYLNVWSPAEAGENLPVMVWIHGGTFVTGAGSQPMFDGTRMARNGKVVLVTINYRLGPFGFVHMSPFSSEFASNAGLLDQIAALKWVQGNISAFGGDPQRVTVFGESAGSMSIAALLAMPAAQGLFAGAIMESGAGQTLQPEQGQEIAAALLAELGLTPGSDLEVLDNLPAEQILEAAARMTYKLSGEALSMFFQPVIEPMTVPADPAEAIAGGSAQGIPLLIGTNLHEGNLFFREERPGESFEQSLKALEMLMGIDDLAELAVDYPKSWEGQAELLTDLFFWGSSIAFAETQSAAAPVWMYRFDWTVQGHPLLEKAVHGAEILYVFGNLHLLKQYGLTVTPDMQKLSETMQKTWTAFAHRGDPSIPGLEWPPYRADSRATVIFDGETQVVLDPDAEKRRRLFSAQANWPKVFSGKTGE
ncbi:carboxylesterase/lipase family protein [Paenibacillus sp. P32E]|uniref:carboxylesterase/lipase family protein n=1 Tax=Paenibacillus sp. P32E TaxID=1349434 RepID=UPI00093B19D4|nr:carboxylesterase/lipase family protein [Paenibacillus sp. P32E]OKP84379.1 para-nitrobenzyl esterase [Paenibacillus sp. P32E]